MSKRLRRQCRKCKGIGRVEETGDPIPLEELTVEQQAETMVNGGTYYRTRLVLCPKCRGVGRV